MFRQVSNYLKYTYKELWDNLIYLPDFFTLGFGEIFWFIFSFLFRKIWNVIALICYLPWTICRSVLKYPLRIAGSILLGIFGLLGMLFLAYTAIVTTIFLIVLLFTFNFKKSLHVYDEYIDDLVLPLYENIKDFVVSFADSFSLLATKEGIIVLGGYTVITLIISIVIWHHSKTRSATVTSDISSDDIFNYCKEYSLFKLMDDKYRHWRRVYLRGVNINNNPAESITFVFLQDILKESTSFGHIAIESHKQLRKLLYVKSKKDMLSRREMSFIFNPLTHVDFLCYDTTNKRPLLAIETDGYTYHRRKKQVERDRIKDHIFQVYQIPLIRLNTQGCYEYIKIRKTLNEIVEQKRGLTSH